ncbi:MAG: hypothetical protein ACYSW0_23910 [Planctomycetota bacterium]|jgi:hypothetical protein
MIDQGLPRTLTGSLWAAGLHYYDFWQTIDFNPDGSGTMSYGDSQSLRTEADFKFKLLGPQQIRFEFFDTVNEIWGKIKTFERTEDNAFRTVGFRLSKGPFAVQIPYIGERHYEYSLEFDSVPFPIGYNSAEDLLTYYGWRDESESADS